MWCINFIILVGISFLNSAESQEFLHESMKPHEIEILFGSSHIPSYKIVPVSHTLYSNNIKRRVVEIFFEQPMRLYLEPNDGLLAGVKTQVYKAKSLSGMKNKLKFQRLTKVIKNQGKFYQDPLNKAALYVTHDRENKPVFNGVIDQVAVRPLPERFRSQFKRDKRSANDEFLQSNRTVYHSNLEDTHHHIVFKIHNEKSIGNLLNLKTNRKYVKKKHHGKEATPKTIYPQILVFMDSTLFTLFDKRANGAVDYLLSFWNAVDLRYRIFQQPNIRLNIAGFILAEDAGVTKYLSKNIKKIPGHFDQIIQVDDSLHSKAEMFYYETHYHKTNNSMIYKPLGLEFDVVITMTALRLCSFNSKKCFDSRGEYQCNAEHYYISSACSALGYAYNEGVCSYNIKTRLMESVGITHDRSGFNGIIPTAHELGHLFGASHSDDNRYQCPVQDGYLMSSIMDITRDSFVFSNCSLNSIKDFLQSPSAACLSNQPVVGERVKRVLPGKILSRDEQCQRLVKSSSCKDDVVDKMCDQLYCKIGDRCRIVKNAPVPEGSSCGDGFHCINARCTNRDEKKVLIWQEPDEYDYDEDPFESFY
ncbi:hypothetical protein TKK_0016026 [Trichogramma kaykai]|uniref:Peptidase M12B domain-containing protein n=1 Tax=Trichogramma kaykai TaxID=54128 RepID=A0ABD2W9J5_9HYME